MESFTLVSATISPDAPLFSPCSKSSPPRKSRPQSTDSSPAPKKSDFMEQSKWQNNGLCLKASASFPLNAAHHVAERSKEVDRQSVRAIGSVFFMTPLPRNLSMLEPKKKFHTNAPCSTA